MSMYVLCSVRVVKGLAAASCSASRVRCFGALAGLATVHSLQP